MDSTVLLHLLHSLAPRFEWRLSAVHVHHGISPNADAWSDFCAGLCASYDIPLHIERVDIAPLRGDHGIEAAARKLRHGAFASLPCDFVALAHHADDQVETMMLQLLRGAGIKGAAAMPVLSRVEGPLFRAAPATVRPLLDVSRGTLLEYARQHGLQWVEDESNADESYPRNFLRHRVMPLLANRFPAYRETLVRSARHFAEAGELLDELARQDAPGLAEAGTLDTALLHGLPPVRARNLLRYFLHIRGVPMPHAAQLDEMLRQLLQSREDGAACIVTGHWQVRRYQGEVHIERALEAFDRDLVLPWRGEAALDWPANGGRLSFTQIRGQGISLARLQAGPVTLRLRHGGEVLRPHPAAAARSLKNLLQERHVPPWRRERLPLLYCGEELASVVGVAVAAGFQATPDEPGIVVTQAS